MKLNIDAETKGLLTTFCHYNKLSQNEAIEYILKAYFKQHHPRFKDSDNELSKDIILKLPNIKKVKRHSKNKKLW